MALRKPSNTASVEVFEELERCTLVFASGGQSKWEEALRTSRPRGALGPLEGFAGEPSARGPRPPRRLARRSLTMRRGPE